MGGHIYDLSSFDDKEFHLKWRPQRWTRQGEMICKGLTQDLISPFQGDSMRLLLSCGCHTWWRVWALSEKQRKQGRRCSNSAKSYRLITGESIEVGGMNGGGNRRREGSKSRLWWQLWWEHALWNGVVTVRMERQAVLVALLFVGTKCPSRRKWREESTVGLWFESKSIMEGKPGQPEPWSGSRVTHARFFFFPISAKNPSPFEASSTFRISSTFWKSSHRSILNFFSYLVPNTVK